MTDHGAHPGPDADPSDEPGTGRSRRESAWDDVALHFSNLGKQVRRHFDQPSTVHREPDTTAADTTAPGAATDVPPTAEPGVTTGPGADVGPGAAGGGGPAGPPADATSPATDPAAGREQPTGPGGERVRRWIDTLDDTFTKLGETVRDPEFRRDAGASVNRLGVALGETLREFGDQMQQRFGNRADGSDDRAWDDVPPPSAPGAGGPGSPPPAPGAKGPGAPPEPSAPSTPPPGPAGPVVTPPPASAEPDTPPGSADPVVTPPEDAQQPPTDDRPPTV